LITRLSSANYALSIVRIDSRPGSAFDICVEASFMNSLNLGREFTRQ
jgi:hypothetical protein